MDHFLKDDPIIALSTAQGNAAIALIRISGIKSFSLLKDSFSIKKKIIPRRAIFTKILDDNTVLDEIVLTYYEGPNSYTGENLLELSVHGNQINTNRIINYFVKKKGIRHAQAGEFTYRALRNEKITLSQVEGLDLLLNAKNEFSVKAGLSSLQGELFQEFVKLRECFLKFRSALELSIDFLEDIGEEQANKNMKKTFNNFFLLVKNLHYRSQGDYSSLMNPSVVLIGETNAGKSTLFNKLLATKRSIVSEQAGTTRDFVSEFITISGNSFRLIDTAGIRSSTDKIEQEGIRRAQDLIEKSFFRIYVINPLLSSIDWSLINENDVDAIVFTHADSKEFSKVIKKQILKNYTGPIFISFAPIGPGDGLDNAPIGPSSKLNNINTLVDFISEKYDKKKESNPILIPRQSNKINEIHELLMYYQELTIETNDIGILSNEINNISASIDELIGIIRPEEVLNSIFANFCIGK